MDKNRIFSHYATPILLSILYFFILDILTCICLNVRIILNILNTSLAFLGTK